MPPDMQNLPTDDKGPLIIGMTVMFEVFACIAMAMRFWSLSIRRQKMAIHDILIVIGFVSGHNLCYANAAISLLTHS